MGRHRLRITHCFPTIRNLGGAEAVLNSHRCHDADYGIDSQFIIYYEKKDPPIDRVAFLELDTSSTIKLARERFAAAIASQKPDFCVYHGMWGLQYLVDLDSAQRRLVYNHGYGPDAAPHLRRCEPWADAFVTVSRPQWETTRQILPQFEPERLGQLSCPIFPPPTPPVHPPLQSRPVIIGYCGRLSDDAKRVDRAPAFVAALDAAGIDYRMELLGEGPLQKSLQNHFKSNPRVIFHGRKTGEAYWQTLRQWDFLILFSDTEGTPISILETMDQGILPLMPGINSGADYYARQLGPEFVYPPHDFTIAAQNIRNVISRPAEAITALRQRSRELVAAHHAENYFASFRQFVEQIQTLPRRSTQNVPSQPWPIRSLKFSSLQKLSTLRQRLGR